jgi:hypothetical protein
MIIAGLYEGLLALRGNSVGNRTAESGRVGRNFGSIMRGMLVVDTATREFVVDSTDIDSQPVVLRISLWSLRHEST